MDDAAAIVERRGNVALVTINRPEARNAVNGAVSAAVVFRIVDQLPRKVALELLFTGEPMSSHDALKWGLINQVVPDGTVVQAALALAERITVNAPLSVQASKRVAYGADDGIIADEEPMWERTIREFTRLLKSEDARQGPLAFAEKRPPVWKAR